MSDIDRAMAFYNTIAGWEFAPLTGMPAATYRRITNSPDGSVGGALVAGFSDRVGDGSIIYIRVDDLAVATAAVTAAGGTREAKSRRINPDDGQFALARDPEGNLIGLWSP